jgi:hypothetical protein
MPINYQFGNVDSNGAPVRAQAKALDAEHQAIVRDVLTAGDFWGRAGSVACQEFVIRLGSQLPGDLPARQLPWLHGADRGRQHGRRRPRRRIQLGLSNRDRERNA